MSKSEAIGATIKINDVEYIRNDAVPQVPRGSRAVIVVDRGWIFAGDVTMNGDKIVLDRAVWVFRWEVVGFDGVIANPKDARVQLKPLANPVIIPVGSEIFRVPVAADWGL